LPHPVVELYAPQRNNNVQLIRHRRQRLMCDIPSKLLTDNRQNMCSSLLDCVVISGYKTYLILDATRGINAETIDSAVAHMINSGK